MDVGAIPSQSVAMKKRLIDAIPAAARRLRSKIPRRKRSTVSHLHLITAMDPEDDEGSSSSCFLSVSSLLPAGSDVSKPPQLPGRMPAIAADENRPVTRWYSRRKGLLRSKLESAAPEISKQTVEKAPAISESSALESVSEVHPGIITKPALSESSVVQRKGDTCDLDLLSDLACSERLSVDIGSGSSEFDSDIFLWGSSSGYATSMYLDSSDDFSDHSTDHAPSPMFSFFLDLRRQLHLFPSLVDSDSSSRSHDQSPMEFTVMRFEEDDDEESYRGLRSRERRNGTPRSYTEEYAAETSNGDLVLQQRLLMVNWIIEHAKAMELHNETMFLGVSLLDRFLSKGYFTTEKNLQLLGIACITLATRIEENQPYNSIRQKSLTVGSNVYTRSDVVSMEWLVMEVLSFQCFLPTIHNFLWFYLKAGRADAQVEALARYLAVLSLLDHEHLSFWPSTIAASLVILASLATDHDSSCHLVMEAHVRTKNDDLPECIQSLEWLVKYAC
ncbi:hypothetical protein J5N97_005943 [Dioscorea zingiberensis]|uniref:Cyclin-like domain-containing protein n=1 Tax=Dioscorea zingiberensis TaxID=325984 RepID=A0A9D5HTJ9_9LILI|nr:hypothetical protein J5N97_005943 [Dioscorea zingiberensis]